MERTRQGRRPGRHRPDHPTGRGGLLLFIEVDNCHETAEEIAGKLEKYARFFRRTVKDTDGTERLMWRTRWSAPATSSGDAAHPPVLLVFSRIGERNPDRTIARLHELTC
ncbi:replication-relaxation family protein [Streptomyces lavenduligriseus]|uniref:Replication-relaxation family protein n=1 Tax=Streptomyces lavenduligriseus TaxID=67315 RepID=A0ABT0NVL7_9ACTN|nr:replication-relaxation family protein [Streptomyces lavenduligriseus]MCL3995508.1 replication-relaxation family protein [Streptomyces lavenduligriseus]